MNDSPVFYCSILGSWFNKLNYTDVIHLLKSIHVVSSPSTLLSSSWFQHYWIILIHFILWRYVLSQSCVTLLLVLLKPWPINYYWLMLVHYNLWWFVYLQISTFVTIGPSSAISLLSYSVHDFIVAEFGCCFLPLISALYRLLLLWYC